MCGIVGYIGTNEAQPIIFNCMKRLEYRGYDSCGIAICGSELNSYKNVGGVNAIQESSPAFKGTLGIGHTRWATHGYPNRTNAHPQFDCSGKIAVVHNGIITNYQQLKKRLIQKGHVFSSETDTEVIPHLIEEYYLGDLQQAVENALVEIEGTLSIVVLREGHNELIACRRDSPLVIGISEGEAYVASDVTALMDYTDEVCYLNDGDIVGISPNGMKLLKNGKSVTPDFQKIRWDKTNIDKHEFDHFMLKEIFEQPEIIEQSAEDISKEHYLYTGYKSIPGDLSEFVIIACGTSYHAGLVGKYIIEETLGIPVRVELASELNHRKHMIIPGLTIVISQSGETADVLVPLKKLKESGANTIVVTNVFGSTASRLSDSVLYTKAGPEISVAATKTFIAQLLEIYKIALFSPMVNPETRKQAFFELSAIPSKIRYMLENSGKYQDYAKFISGYNELFIVGRGINYPVALEGALKLKEISYIHAEGYACGELKHGPFALLSADTPVLAIVANDDTHDAMISNIKEIQARRSPVSVLVDTNDSLVVDIADSVIPVPPTPVLFTPILNTVAVQLISYYAARFRGCPIDYPRNLAKTVTVE